MQKKNRIKLKIYTLGKLSEPWLGAGIDQYSAKLSYRFSLSWVIAKNNAQLHTSLRRVPRFFALDPQGSSLCSVAFTRLLASECSLYGPSLAFLIGGPLGIEPSLLSQAARQISLSPMTWPHQMARLLLLEQLYRSAQITDQTPYHK